MTACLYLLVIGAVFWRPLFAGEAFIPGDQVRYLAPWSAHSPAGGRPAWNPLHYDSVGQFHSWAVFGAKTLRSGVIPLWNPYQLCGTPFVGNSQSAVYYPPNVLRPLLGAARSAGWIAAAHLLAAALLTCLFLRALGLSAGAATVGGLAYSLSTWQIAWLHLPTFAASSCWLPGVLLALHALRYRPTPLAAAGLASALGMTLLAGHLQVAFYVMLCGALYAGRLVMVGDAAKGTRARFAAWAVCSLIVAVLVAAPQLLPSAELSRHSHRTGGPTAEGYDAYRAYAVHPAATASLAHPDIFGNPSSPASPYAGFSRGGMYFNYAEGALYLGLLPVLMAAVGIARARARPDARFPAAMAGLALLVAVGTPLVALLYFGIPGFSQSGSPGRILVLWAFAGAWLAAIGFDETARGRLSVRGLIAPALALAAFIAVALVTASAASRSIVGGLPLALDAVRQQVALAALSLGAVVWSVAKPGARAGAVRIAVAVLCCDLLVHGATYNATCRPDAELARHEAIARIAAMAGHDRAAPINGNWSFAGPTAVLPPNLSMLFGVRDVQGYDSLLPGQYKRWLLDRTGSDPSPPEVGNMLFLKAPDPNVLDACGVRVVASPSRLGSETGVETQADGIWLYERTGGRPRATALTATGQAAQVDWLTDQPNLVRLAWGAPEAGTLELADQYWPGWKCRADGRDIPIRRHNGVFREVGIPERANVVEFRYDPAATRLGHFLMGLGLCAVGLALAFGLTSRGALTAAE